MIKADTLKKLTKEVIVNQLIEHLEPFGFKYLKSGNQFKKTRGNFDTIIYLVTSVVPLQLDKVEKLQLSFGLNIAVKSSKFDKWVSKKLGVWSAFHHSVENINCTKSVDFDQLNNGDLFTPGESQQFKNYVTSSLAGSGKHQECSLSEFITRIPTLCDTLDRLSSAKELLKEKQKGSRDYLRLLVFEEELDLAKEEYLKVYHTLTNEIHEQLNANPEEAKKKIQELEEYLLEINTLLGIDLENPFLRELKKAVSKHQKVKLACNLWYEEVARLDTSLVNIQSFDLNDRGEVLILLEDRELVKVQESGEIKKIGHLRLDDCFRKDLNSFRVKWLEEAQVFVCNNFIVSEKEELIELTLDFDASQFHPNSLTRGVQELLFDKVENKYHLLFSTGQKTFYHSVFNREGRLLSTKKLDRDCIKINLARKEIIVHSESNSFDSVDFDGNEKGNYKYGNGNDRIALSPDGNLMILHFYSTKSQLFDLDTGAKKTLWAHPTYLKGYKENFYNNINHNFGMTTCCFTPDGSHIIGGANHGKYVLWDTSKLERRELIPSEASMQMFNWYTTTQKKEKSIKNYFKPYTATLEGNEFFINRGYDISNVSFIDGGKYTITQIKDSLLIWDADFNNVGSVYGIGEATFTSKNYFAINTNGDFVLFKRANDFNNDFESSVFKEVEGEDSFITYIDVSEVENKEEIKEKVEKMENQPEKSKKGLFARLFKR